MDLSEQMRITVLQRARSPIVSRITIHDEDARQRLISKDGLRDLRRTGLTKQKKADRIGGKKPNVTILAVGSPAGFIGVLDRGLAIQVDQFGENRSEETGDPMEAIDEAARMDLQLLTNTSERDSMQIIHHRCIGHELVAIEVFREDSRDRRLEGAPTLGTIAFGEPINPGFSPKRAALQHEPLGVAFIHERSAALRTEVSDGSNNGMPLFSLNEIGTRTSPSKVSRPSSLRFTFLFLRPIGFEGNLRGGR